jgi:hypothetical protein
MKIYQIDCEWDMGFREFYETKKEAQQAIDGTDWIGMVDMTFEEAEESGLVRIIEVE